MESTIKKRLDRTAFRKRLEQKRHELTARIRETQAKAAEAGSSHVEAWRSLLAEIEDAVKSGVDTLEEATIERLNGALDRFDDAVSKDGR